MAQGVFRPVISNPRSVDELVARLSAGDLAPADVDHRVLIGGVAVVSSSVEAGDVFVALPGAKTHGARYAMDALSRGAVAVVTDAVGADLLGSVEVPVIVVKDPRSELGTLSAWVYGTDTSNLVTLGITGTNGKTSTSFFIEELLGLLSVKSGLSSTAEIHLGDGVFQPRLTTPEACEVHAFLASCVEHRATAAIVEVSAQAMTHHRVDAVAFDVVGFTNLSHDHLDEYGDLENYFAAKLSLFTPEHAARAVVSLESAWGAKLADLALIPVVTLSRTPDQDSDWHVQIHSEDAQGTTFNLSSRDGQELTSHVDVIGQHMASNAALAILMVNQAGWSMDDIFAALKLSGGFHVNPPGRIERVSGAMGPNVFVDSGHTPEAITVTLESVRRITSGSLIGLVGAGGNRDTLKRFPLGEITAQLCDTVIVTDDNSRFEDPAEIRAEVMRGALSAAAPDAVHEIGDNRDAIEFAVSRATSGDSIVWLGLGNETYREVMGEKRPHSARDLARTALSEAGWS